MNYPFFFYSQVEEYQAEIVEEPSDLIVDKIESIEKTVDKVESFEDVVEGDDISLVSEVSHLTSPRNNFFNLIIE